jgi:hypothetical protein
MGASIGDPGNSPSIGGTQMGASIGDPGNSLIRGGLEPYTAPIPPYMPALGTL